MSACKDTRENLLDTTSKLNGEKEKPTKLLMLCLEPLFSSPRRGD
jgi:hypothetical protein